MLDLLGYVGALLVFCSFYLRTMIGLRLLAVASNVVFIIYGVSAALMPIVALHSVLMPLNFLRLVEVRRLIRKVRESAQRGARASELIVPYMRPVRRSRGEAVFSKGDSAHCVYYLLKGSVRLTGRNIVVPEGQMIGLIGVFSPEHMRTDNAVCQTDVELGEIGMARILELCHQSPDFGAFLMRMVAQRAALVTPP